MYYTQVQNAGSLFDSFAANQTIANAIWNSGPASGAPVGSNMMCPNYVNSWTYEILFGSTSSLNVSETSDKGASSVFLNQTDRTVRIAILNA